MQIKLRSSIKTFCSPFWFSIRLHLLLLNTTTTIIIIIFFHLGFRVSMYEIIIRVLAFSLLCLSAPFFIYNIIALTHPKEALAFFVWEVLNHICSIHCRKSHETIVTNKGDHHQIPLVSFLRNSYSCCHFSSLSHSLFII